MVSWRRKTDEVSLVLVVEAEGLNEHEQRRLNDMWHGLFAQEGAQAVAESYKGTRGRKDREKFLELLAVNLAQWVKYRRDALQETYGTQPRFTKLELLVCRGDVVSAQQGGLAVLATIDLLQGRVL